jgi:hypothetical protein
LVLDPNLSPRTWLAGEPAQWTGGATFEQIWLIRPQKRERSFSAAPRLPVVARFAKASAMVEGLLAGQGQKPAHEVTRANDFSGLTPPLRYIYLLVSREASFRFGPLKPLKSLGAPTLERRGRA